MSDNKARALLLALLAFCFFGTLALAQGAAPNDDFVYHPNVRSVEFGQPGVAVSLPIVGLGEGLLRLAFDDLDADVKDYYYTIEHCNADWTRSRLNELEYLQGFPDDRLLQYDNAFNTRVPFTHYELVLPNANMRWTKSGNYVLRLYVGGDREDVVLTRRFMVVEPLVRVAAEVVRPFEVRLLRSHQEVDVLIDHKGLVINSPQNEVSLTVLQNGRWDNAIAGLRPRLARENLLDFDYQGQIVFEAGKEFRHLDLRSLRYNSDKVEQIGIRQDGFDVLLLREGSREAQPYLLAFDLNGHFFIETSDDSDPVLQSDYADVFFYYALRYPYEEGDVYLFGKFTDWQLMEDYKMRYREDIRAYEGHALLKQGFYNYYYAYVPAGAMRPDISETEGNYFEAENNYTILLYFRPFGERYDRLIAAHTVNSLRR